MSGCSGCSLAEFVQKIQVGMEELLSRPAVTILGVNMKVAQPYDGAFATTNTT